MVVRLNPLKSIVNLMEWNSLVKPSGKNQLELMKSSVLLILARIEYR